MASKGGGMPGKPSASAGSKGNDRFKSFVKRGSKPAKGGGKQP